MSNREDILVQKAVIKTLQMLGIDSGLVSYNRAQKVWGKPFREAVRKGEISPICVGNGVNGTKTYAIEDILNIMV